MTHRVLFWVGLLICSVAVTSHAEHLPPVDPISSFEDHSHEDHSGHRASGYLEGTNLSFTNFSDAVFGSSTGLFRMDFTGAVFDRA